MQQSSHRERLGRWAAFAIILCSIIVCFVAAKALRKNDLNEMNTISTTHLPDEGKLPSFKDAVSWINTAPVSATSLKGKVVLVQFWTYSCINWFRTLPYTKAWAEKYKDQGLVVIGVHSPEFGFEKDTANVHAFIRQWKIDYPVAVDSRMGVWDAFNNQYWPALYLADAKGILRYHRFGEGEYDQTEKVIQQLLADAGAKNINHQLVSVNPTGPEVAADWDNLGSGENYLGSDRTENFSSPGRVIRNKPVVYKLPSKFSLNDWALSGNWTIQGGSIISNEPGGKIVYQFHARDVNMVMAPSITGKPVRFRVSVDGSVPGDAHGTDVNAEGYGMVDGPRVYQLIRQHGAISDRLFEIEFLDAGVEGFSFTFG